MGETKTEFDWLKIVLGSIPENQGETKRLTLAKLRSVVSLYEKRGSEEARKRGSEEAR